MDKDLKPTKIERINCPTCGELMIKIYPWSSIRSEMNTVPNCRKCIQEYRNKGGGKK